MKNKNVLSDVFSLVIKERIFVGYVVAVLFLVFSQPTRPYIFFGLLFCIAGEIIRTYSSATIMKNKKLTTKGPYSYVRNPLYLGSFIIGIGVFVMGGERGLLFLALYIPAFLFIYNEKIKGEEVKLREIFQEDFDNYVLNVPRFFPRLTPWNKEDAKIELRLIKVHKEYNAWLGIYAITIVMLLKSH